MEGADVAVEIVRASLEEDDWGTALAYRISRFEIREILELRVID